MNPKFEFSASATSKLGSEKPTFSSMSSLARPRMVKSRKSVNNNPVGSSETRKNEPGINPIRPVPDSVDGDVNENVGGGDNGVGHMSRSKYVNLKVSNKVEKLGKELVDEIRKLRIENQNVGSNANVSGNAGFSQFQQPRKGGDNVLTTELPEELKRMNLGGSCGEGLKVRGGSTVGDSCADMMYGLPNNLKKLNLKDAAEGRGSSFVLSTTGRNDFVFGSIVTKNEAVDPGMTRTLPDSIKNLKTSDSEGCTGTQKEMKANVSNRPFSSGGHGTVCCSGGVRDTMVLDEMEKLKIGAVCEGSTSHQNETASLSERSTSAQVSNQSNEGSGLPRASASSTSSFSSAAFQFQPVRNQFQVPCTDQAEKEGFSFGGRQEIVRTRNIEFRTPEAKGNFFTGSNRKMEFSSKKGAAKGILSRGRKGKVKEPNPILISLANNVPSKENSVEPEPSESYSPMDFSPYSETHDDAKSAAEPSLTSNNPASTASQAAFSYSAIDEDLVTVTGRMDNNECDDLKRDKEKVNGPECTISTHGDTASPLAGCVSASEAESFRSAVENLEHVGENEVESKCGEESCDQTQYLSASSSLSSGGSSFTFAASSPSHSQASSAMRHHRKKNRMKAGPDICVPPRTATLSDATSSLQFSPVSMASGLPLLAGQNDCLSTVPPKGGIHIKITSPTSKRQGANFFDEAKKVNISPSAAARAAQEACEKWRLRGNQAYANGDLRKAEDHYTQGLSCIPRHETSRDCLRSLVLCYSNRAATFMSLGRMREALKDCLDAGEIDPKFFRVQLRAANFYLALGEIGDASRYFKKLLQSTDVCVERKIILEASDGLQKAQKVSDCMDRVVQFLRNKTCPDAASALGLVDEALVISPYSEQLLESKAEALFMLRRYEEVIQLCERTLEAAEKNSSLLGVDDCLSDSDSAEILKIYSFRMWRYGFIFKSNFYLGKLEEAVDFLEKQENWSYMITKCGNEALESLIPQLSTSRELLRLKSAGNGAFQTGRHTEAIEHYTAALSFNVESRPFAAVCFCNRAAAFQALGQVTDAIADCSLAISLDGNYLKAISRRATLFEMIRDYDQAAKNLQRLVSLLTKQAEETANPSGASMSMGSLADLRQARHRLYQMEEQDKKGLPLNLYLILGVEPSVTAKDLKKAYRKAALRHHPDKAGQSLARSESGDDGLWKEIAEEVHRDADKLFKMIGEAYAVLSDPSKRSQFDIEEEMRNGQLKNGNRTSRMHSDTSFQAAERGSVGRQWREGWRSSTNAYSRGFEPTRPGRFY